MCLPPTLTYCFAVCNKAGMQEKQRELRTHLDAIARGNAGVPVSVNLHHTDLPLQLVRHALPRSSHAEQQVRGMPDRTAEGHLIAAEVGTAPQGSENRVNPEAAHREHGAHELAGATPLCIKVHLASTKYCIQSANPSQVLFSRGIACWRCMHSSCVLRQGGD